MAFDAFTGEQDSRMDSKGRVSIPATFRRVLDLGNDVDLGPRTHLFLVYGWPDRDWVAGYSAVGYQKLIDLIRTFDEGSDDHLVAKSARVDVDDDGRIVMPPAVRKKLGVTVDDGAADLHFHGSIDNFQLWKLATYESRAETLDRMGQGLVKEGKDISSLLRLARSRQ